MSMTTELYQEDIERFAKELADEQAKKLGIRRKRKRPMWFLAVLSDGCQLRVAFQEQHTGNTYTTSMRL